MPPPAAPLCRHQLRADANLAALQSADPLPCNKMLETGEFEVPHSYIGVGDEYVEHREKPLHHIKGVKQFVVSSPKKGQTAGTLGGTYTAKPLFDVRRRANPGIVPLLPYQCSVDRVSRTKMLRSFLPRRR